METKPHGEEKAIYEFIQKRQKKKERTAEAGRKLPTGIESSYHLISGTASIAAAVTDDLTGKVSAVDLVRAGVEALGGKGGGGRADMAQGGGPDGDKADAAIAAAKGVIAG